MRKKFGNTKKEELRGAVGGRLQQGPRFVRNSFFQRDRTRRGNKGMTEASIRRGEHDVSHRNFRVNQETQSHEKEQFRAVSGCWCRLRRFPLAFV